MYFVKILFKNTILGKLFLSIMMKSLVRLIGSENFWQEVIQENKAVLLLCMPQNHQFLQQFKIIENIAIKHSNELKVRAIEEGFIRKFKENYNIVGTPTFLILAEGKEKGRLLGMADEETIMNFISNSLNRSLKTSLGGV